MGRLTIRDCSAETLDVAADVDELFLWNVRFPTFPAIPVTVRSLYMDSCTIADGSPMVLHEGLETLRIGLQTCLPTSFPSSLRALFLRKIRIETLPALPEGLQRANFLRLQTRTPVVLPASLEVLSLDECTLSVFPAFPANLRKLMVRECYGRTLPSFPTNLQELFLSDLTLDYLPPIPATCVMYETLDVEAEQRGGVRGLAEDDIVG